MRAAYYMADTARACSKTWKGVQQFENLIELLKKRPTSRQAVLQLFDSTDLAKPHEDVPCTCTLQFLMRGGKLHLVVYMRSNDVIKGLPHDIFCFTMLQEMVARIMSVDLGIYKHCVGSLHLYDTDKSKAESFMREGLAIDKIRDAAHARRRSAPGDHFALEGGGHGPQKEL